MQTPPVRVYGPRKRKPPGARTVNVTSKSKEAWARGLSPFVLGPVYVWPGQSAVPARNVENAWQFSKVYSGQVGPGGDPTAVHAVWALRGWRAARAERFPKGRGAVPLYSIYCDARLGYVAARLYIYVPAYVEGLATSPGGRAGYRRLVAERAAAAERGLTLYDFDGYDHVAAGLDFAGTLLNERKKGAHAFVLAALLEDRLVVGHRRAADECPEVAALEADGLPLPLLPDFAPLREAELYAPYAPVMAEVYYRANFLGRLADRALAALLPGGEAGIDWQQRQVNVFGWRDENRLTAFYGDPGTKYKYSGRDNDARPWADDPSGVLAMVKELLELVTGERYNLCLLNLYEDRRRNIGKHSDDERDLVPGSRIASVSLGAPRAFCLEPKVRSSGAALLTGAEFPATHGCLLTMGGRTQALFKHWVPPGKVEEGPRVNLTFRRVRAR